ncbi:hypothetical protein N2603_36340 [Bradyrhizobium huanghuaihaiense]|uniref:hypothetical protein n=1 Tax=Bradyrhizobium huanghuaihaiense TaxID=990078 RepID=UPI0021AA783C|nr:hypothetical protein [Bradyrhizobium sp. CB3035]UWU75453.1 hypothetical protein N2603_36340 [Bradyrhizobium sp. CB3035]
MDMKEASAMTEASGLVSDTDGVELVSGESPAARAVRSPPSSDAALRWAEQLREVTVRNSLQALLVAFLLGVWVARRR